MVGVSDNVERLLLGVTTREKTENQTRKTKEDGIIAIAFLTENSLKAPF